jgi:hypothetical protein
MRENKVRGGEAGGGKEVEEHLLDQLPLTLHALAEGGAQLLERRQTQQHVHLQHLLHVALALLLRDTGSG